MKIIGLRAALAATAAISFVSLSACSSEASDDADLTTQESTTDTVAALLGAESDLSTLSKELGAAGFSTMLDGQASYTVLAPTNTAFGAIEGGDAMLSDAENGALVAAILREHILPGSLTPEAIKQAAADNGGTVTMRSFGTGVVSFSVEGEDVTMQIGDGPAAKMASGAIIGGNGVVIPVDTVLITPAPVAAE